MPGILSLHAGLITPSGSTGLGGTWDPATKAASITLSNGNLTATSNGSNGSALGTSGKTSGSWSFTVTLNTTAHTNGIVGIANTSYPASTIAFLGKDTNGIGYDAADGNIYYNNGSVVSTGVTCTTNDVITVEYNVSTSAIQWKKNGTLIPSSALTYSITGTIVPAISQSGDIYTANFS